MRPLKTFCLLLITSIAIQPLAGQTYFQFTYGGSDSDYGHSVQQTADGGYILFGQTRSFGAGSQDMYLVKTNASGIQQWQKTFGGINVEFGISLRQTTDGGYILCGSFSGFGNDSLALIKTDALGNLVWNKRYSDPSGRDVGHSVYQTTDGGYIASGWTGTSFMEDIYLVKTDMNGVEQWNKVFPSTGREYGVCVKQVGGNYLILGETDCKGHGGRDMYFLKTNSSGDTLWTRTFGTAAHEIGRSFYPTTDGGYVLLGYEDQPGGNLYMVKTNSLGNEVWHQYFGDAGWDMGYCIQQTTDGGYILSGRKENMSTGNHEMYAIKTNSTGTVVWEHTYPNGWLSDAFSVQQTSDGGYILLGTTTDTTGGVQNDMYLVKIDANGIAGINENIDELATFAYPVPFSEHVTIVFDNRANEPFQLLLFNIHGQLVRTLENIRDEKIILDGRGLLPGIYFYNLISRNKLTGRGKLISLGAD